MVILLVGGLVGLIRIRDSGKLHIICSENGNIIIKCVLKKDSVYEEIFNDHYSNFGTFLNSMRFFRQIFIQR